jgi:hypothetical protein
MTQNKIIAHRPRRHKEIGLLKWMKFKNNLKITKLLEQIAYLTQKIR